MKVLSTIIFCLLLAMLSSCSNHGAKVSKENIEVYYKDGVTESEAQKLADYLYPIYGEGDKDTKSIQAVRNGDTVIVRMVLADKSTAPSVDEHVMLNNANRMSASIFNNAPVNIELTDTRFKVVRIIAFKKIEPADYGEKIRVGTVDLYYKNGFNTEEATAIAAFINREAKSPSTISFQTEILTQPDTQYVIRMFGDKQKTEALGDAFYNDLAELVSDSAYNGSPLTFELTDSRFKAYKTFHYDGSNK